MSLLVALARRPAALRPLLRSPTSLGMAPARGEKTWVGLQDDQDYWAKQAKLNRPRSPSLFIYRFPLPAIMSISHRATGVALTGAISFGAMGLVASGEPLEVWVAAIKALELPGAVTTGAKFALALPTVYHSINGIRHLVWDSATTTLGLESVYRSGYILLATSAAVSLGFALL